MCIRDSSRTLLSTSSRSGNLKKRTITSLVSPVFFFPILWARWNSKFFCVFHLQFITKECTLSFWRVLSTIGQFRSAAVSSPVLHLLVQYFIRKFLNFDFIFLFILLQVYNFAVSEFLRLVKFIYFSFQFSCLDANLLSSCLLYTSPEPTRPY